MKIRGQWDCDTGSHKTSNAIGQMTESCGWKYVINNINNGSRDLIWGSSCFVYNVQESHELGDSSNKCCLGVPILNIVEDSKYLMSMELLEIISVQWV